MIVKICCTISLLLSSSLAFACPTSQSLFEQMQGIWIGQGTSFQMVTNESWPVSVETSSDVIGAELFVRNSYKEARPAGMITYETHYIITPIDQSCRDSGKLKVAMRRNLEDPKSLWVYGDYDGTLLVLNQNLGEDFVLLSHTFFSGARTTHRMLFVHSGSIVQRVELGFQRVLPKN
ncbi:MAG: hypothetical protein KDD61_14475 [Bdellovibrionales bacterium]|nr:hypothetical protein [Bdellovibrionales bacterium]